MNTGKMALTFRSLLRRTLIAICITLSVSSRAFAHEDSVFEVLGFSDDNRYAAILEWYSGDGGALWIRTAIIDIRHNVFRGTPVVTTLYDDDDGEATDIEMALHKAREDLLKRGRRLSNGWRPGVQLTVGDDGSLIYGDKTLGKLTLLQRDWTGKQPEDCYTDGVARIATLTYVNGSRRQVLNDDKRLPASRRCAVEYALGPVAWRSGNGFIFNLRYKRPGFEGLDTWTIPVGAQIEGADIIRE